MSEGKLFIEQEDTDVVLFDKTSLFFLIETFMYYARDIGYPSEKIIEVIKVLIHKACVPQTLLERNASQSLLDEFSDHLKQRMRGEENDLK